MQELTILEVEAVNGGVWGQVFWFGVSAYSLYKKAPKADLSDWEMPIMP